jgi:hypothetical protein
MMDSSPITSQAVPNLTEIYYRKAVVAPIISELDAALADLQQQGLTVRLHSRPSNTWHIADGGLYSGYVVTAEELVDLRKRKRLNLQSIKDL